MHSHSADTKHDMNTTKYLSRWTYRQLNQHLLLDSTVASLLTFRGMISANKEMQKVKAEQCFLFYSEVVERLS
jgi:hypothetical protein